MYRTVDAYLINIVVLVVLMQSGTTPPNRITYNVYFLLAGRIFKGAMIVKRGIGNVERLH